MVKTFVSSYDGPNDVANVTKCPPHFPFLHDLSILTFRRIDFKDRFKSYFVREEIVFLP